MYIVSSFSLKFVLLLTGYYYVFANQVPFLNFCRHFFRLGISNLFDLPVIVIRYYDTDDHIYILASGPCC